MKQWFSKSVLWLLVCMTGMTGCGEDTSSKDDVAPLPPVALLHSDDAVYPQEGIRPEPQGPEDYYMRIEWVRNAETDVLGYRVWRGQTAPIAVNPYPVVELEYGVDLPAAASITKHFWIDNGNDANGNPADLLSPVLGVPREHFWLIQAFDEARNFSGFSDTVKYTLIENPYQLEVSQTDDGYLLSWRYPFALRLDYKIRVYSAAGGPSDVMWDPAIFPRYSTQETVVLNFDGNANPFVADCTYVWQLNAVRDSESGAAVYTNFVYSD